MGRVYEAEQTQPRRRVALKVVRSGISSEKALQRFRLEAEILGRLEHEGIARIFEGGSAEGPDGVEPFIAMELIDGLPLDQYVAQEKPDVEALLVLLRRIADAVAHAHRRGIIHRDLKPGNILVQKDGRPKIVDFGVSRLAEGDSSTWFGRTETGQLLGTLAYMSPEQASGAGGDIDTRSDVYTLGVVAYQLIAGFLPGRLPRATFSETIDTIRFAAPEPLDTVKKRIDRDVAVIVHHALEKERDRRYASAEAFAEDIRRYLEHEPIVARPESAIYQISRFARRHRILVAGICATVLAVGMGFYATVRQKDLTEKALRQVEAEKLKALEEKSSAESARDEANSAKADAQARLDDSRAIQRFLECTSKMRSRDGRKRRARTVNPKLATK
jgi:serine/threonine protein kinase